MIGEVGAPVETTLGKIAGEVVVAGPEPIYCYRAIPYATPPVGVRRWRHAEPAEPWTGVRRADRFAPDCPQPDWPETLHYLAEPRRLVSEDCLYLNIWTAAEPGASGETSRPVMVWIHGGGMIWGSSSDPLYDGAELAKKGVVVVTVNYRLGIFGLFTHPELTAESPHGASGNYMLGDQVAALRWVRDNIAQFGGDPQNVTIFGESGGCSCVHLLTAAPMAYGLFHRAIGESAHYLGPMKSLAEAQAEDAAASEPGDTVASLRDLSAAALLRRAEQTRFRTHHNAAIVDGHVIPRSVRETYETARQSPVPLLIGCTRDEGSVFGSINGVPPEVITREMMVRPMLEWADLAAAVQPTYFFFFNHVPVGGDVELPFHDGSRAKLGAFHTSELSFVFNNEKTTPRFSKNIPVGKPSQADLDLADLVSDCWVAFARHGAPTPDKLGEAWAPYDPAGGRYYEFTGDPRRSGLRAGLLGSDSPLDRPRPER